MLLMFCASLMKIMYCNYIMQMLSFLGQKTVLTNVQEELDRMTRKPDSMVTANSSPTENEA